MASTLLMVVVFVFDLIAFALAVAAELRRTTVKVAQAPNFNYCLYDKGNATGLGVGSFVLLWASQALVMSASRCLCCGKALRPSRSRSCAIALFITSWITFAIAVSCLIGAAVENGQQTKRTVPLGEDLSCEKVRKGVFGAGAAFVVLTGILSEAYYACYSRANDGQGNFNPDTGVTMGRL